MTSNFLKYLKPLVPLLSLMLQEKKPKKKTVNKRRSRSRSRGGGSQSDSELLMSETSRVSFDPVLSDAEDKHKGRQNAATD